MGVIFTRTMCYQLEGPNAPCRPAKYQLKWKDVVSWQSNPAQKTYLVSGKDKQKKTWCCVAVPERLANAFEAQVETENIAVTDYGFLVDSGFSGNLPMISLKNGSHLLQIILLTAML